MSKKDLEYYLHLPYTITLKRGESTEANYWIARVVELPHCMTHGATPEEALADIEDAKREWIESNLEDGLPVPEPPKYTGQYHLRMPPSLHEALTLKSESEEVSLNQYMVTALARAVGYPEVNRVPTVIKETKKKYKH
jgi:predicted RNase H-like HicB family nuclease